MRQILILSTVASLGVLTACSGATTDDAATTDTALTQAVEDAGTSPIDSAAAKACLTTFATCVRGGADEKTCGKALRSCIGDVVGRPEHGGARGDGGRKGGPHGGPGDRPPPPDGAGDRRPPPPRGDGGPPPPHGGPGHGHGPGPACIGDLVTCARGTDAIASCVDAHVVCVQEAAASRAATAPATSTP